MPSSSKTHKVFYGWWIVLISMLGIASGTAPFLFASIGLFMLPLGEEFGWNRAQISALLPILTVSLMIAQPLAGRLIDRVGTKVVLIPSTIAFGIGLAAIPTLVSELWHLGLILFFLGTFGVAANTMPYLRTISTWFDKKRGLAIGISISGIGVGYTVVPILVQYVINTAGWRSAYYILSAIVVFVTIPILLLFLKESPADIGQRADGNPAESGNQSGVQAGLSTREAIKKREFWLLVFIFICIAFALHGILIHLVPLLRDKGLNADTAAIIASVMGGTVFVSRIFIGYLIDHYFAPKVALIFFALSALGFLLLSVSSSLVVMYMAAIMIGLSLGAEVDLLAFLCGKYFGLRSFAEIFGILFIAVLLGSSFGPVIFGYGFEAMASYSGVLTFCVLLNLLALIIVNMLGPYPSLDK